jgi:hypothetical protein
MCRSFKARWTNIINQKLISCHTLNLEPVSKCRVMVHQVWTYCTNWGPFTKGFTKWSLMYFGNFLRTYWLTWCCMLRIEVIMANKERTRPIPLQSLAAAAGDSPSTQSNPISIQQLVFKCSSEAGLPQSFPILVPPSSSSLHTDL